MRKMIFSMFVAVLAMMSTGCIPLYRVEMRSPDTGQIHKVAPFGGTMLIRVYNRCSEMLYVAGDVDSDYIPYGESRPIWLPVVLGDNRDTPKDVVFDATTKAKKEMGTKRIQLNSNYNSVLTRKTLIVGGRDPDVSITGACGY
jgi:hypothetical protein